MLKLAIILGSTRAGRVGDESLASVYELAQRRDGEILASWWR